MDDDFPWKIEPSYEGLLHAIESMNCGLLFRDLEGRVVYANERMLEMSGYAPSELEGQPGEILAPEELHDATQEEREAALRGDVRVRMTVLRRRNGRTLPILSIPKPYRNADDELVGTLCVVIDLGEVQTAKQVGSAEHSLRNALCRIAQELTALSLVAGGPEGASALRLDHTALRELSEREREVLVELVGGSRVPAIAKKLFISPHTVRNHLKAMFRKLGVGSQGELIERVRSFGD